MHIDKTETLIPPPPTPRGMSAFEANLVPCMRLYLRGGFNSKLSFVFFKVGGPRECRGQITIRPSSSLLFLALGYWWNRGWICFLLLGSHTGSKQLGGGKVSLAYRSPSIIEWSQGRTWRQELKQRPWRSPVCWLSDTCLASVLYSTGSPAQGQWAALALTIIHQTNPHRQGHRQFWSGQLPDWESFTWLSWSYVDSGDNEDKWPALLLLLGENPTKLLGTEVRGGVERRDVGIKLLGIPHQSPPFPFTLLSALSHVMGELGFSLLSVGLVKNSHCFFLPKLNIAHNQCSDIIGNMCYYQNTFLAGTPGKAFWPTPRKEQTKAGNSLVGPIREWPAEGSKFASCRHRAFFGNTLEGSGFLCQSP